ncbi:hypothetical protein BH11PLA2_BH11PLA2_28000 [soil metagenome]
MLRTAAALAALIAVSQLAEAGGAGDLIPRMGIFRKKKEDPPANDKDKATKVKSLIEILKSDTDAKKRLDAAEDLREYDPRTHVDVIPALTAALKQDPSPEVRAEAAVSLGTLKTVTQPAGVALEQTNANDPSETVRKAAQAALWQYHLNGYRSAGANPAQPQTAEPPLAKPREATAKTINAAPIATPLKANTTNATSTSTQKPKGGVYQQTIEPPMAKLKSEAKVEVVPEVVVPPLPSLNVPPLPTVPTVPVVPGIPSPGPTPSVPPPNN